MDATVTPYAPAPGAAKPGNLYADLQTRTLWLGVDPSIDPAQAVLISDIVAMQADIDGAVLEAKTYTDAQITTRAPAVHNHTASQISDFNSAVTGVVTNLPGFNWVRGMIMMYSGSLAEIGVGGLAGWALCDGANGTPDLRDRFILAAGSRAIGSKNPNASFNTSDEGGHVHTINYYALTIAEMPYHSHGGNTGYMSHDHAHYTSGVTDAQGVHAHNIILGASGQGQPPGSGADLNTRGYGGPVNQGTENAGNHQHNWGNWSGGVNTNHYHGVNPEGGSQGHTHSMAGGSGVHSHSITSLQLRESIPFYALALIMKL